MALSDAAVRAAKPAAAQFKLYDDGGLFMIVKPSGGKLWRLKYRYLGREQQLSLGRYPDVSIKEARRLRDEARKVIADGRDPGAEKKRAAVAAAIGAANTFKALADELITKARHEGRADATLAKADWFLSLLEPALGARPIAEIEAYELLAVLKKVEAVGHHETARRLLAFAGRVFRYAIATTRARSNPAADLRGALVAAKVKHHAAVLDPVALGGLLRAIDGFEGQPATQLALRLAPHVFVRPGELRQAEWAEFDLDASVWRIPSAKMKMAREHVVPLSRQASAILKEAIPLTGSGRYVFPSVRSLHRPMSENTVNAALRRLGYTTDEMTGHGFRSTASTLLNESEKWSTDAIERALAHKDNDHVRAAYHRGTHWDERVRMAQWWSDYLDGLRKGAKVLPIRAAADG
jgi:integrase